MMLKQKNSQRQGWSWWLALGGAVFLMGCGKEELTPAEPGEDPEDEDTETVNPGPDEDEDY